MHVDSQMLDGMRQRSEVSKQQKLLEKRKWDVLVSINYMVFRGEWSAQKD